MYNFSKNPCAHLLEHAWTKSCPQTGQTDKQTDGQTDEHDEINPQKLRLRRGGVIELFAVLIICLKVCTEQTCVAILIPVKNTIL